MKRLCYVLSTFLIVVPFSTVLAEAPETAKIVFRSMRDGNSEIYIMNPDGSDQTNLTQHRAQDLAPVWSPNGSEIAFMAGKFVWAENGNLTFPDVSIEIINLQTHVQEKLLPGSIWMYSPAWAPDSAQIVFTWNGRQEKGFLDRNRIVHTIDIYVVNREGSGLKKIIESGEDTGVSNPTWSPHGDEFIYNTYNQQGRGSRQISKITLDGRVPEQLTHRGNNFNADWFDPAFALPVSPQLSLLTTTWGKLKTRD